MKVNREKLFIVLGGYLAMNPQNEVAQQHLQKIIDALPDNTVDKIYKFARSDIVSRGNRQISAIKQEMERL